LGNWLAWLLALAVLPSLMPNPYVQYVVNLSLILAFATIGLNVIFGYAGQHAFGHPVFFGVGAYASALLAADAAWPVGLAIPAGAIITGALSALIGFPSFRLRGIYFGVATIAFSFVIYIIAQNWIDLTRGPMGIPSVLPLWVLPADNALGLDRDVQNRIVVVALLGVTIWVLVRLLQSPLGRAWIAIRENESLAASVGISPLRYQMLAFVLGAAMAGLGGGFYAHYVGYVSPALLEFHYVGVVFIMLIAGGAGTLAGPLIGSVVFGVLPELLRVAEMGRNLLLGVILLLCIALLPEGLVGLWRRLRSAPSGESAAAAGVAAAAAAAAEAPSSAVHAAPARIPGSRAPGGVLELRGVSKTFGGLSALSDVSFTVQPGELLGLIGPNGAGKTTLFNMITGCLPLSGGDIVYRGRSIRGRSPHQIAAVGITRTFQITSLFPQLTAAENVRIGTHLWCCHNPFSALLRTAAFREAEAAIESGVKERLALVGLTERGGVLASALSYGDQRRLEVAVALATGSSLILLDEPAAGLNAEETDQLCALIRSLKQAGYTIMVIEHDMRLVMSICERIVVLNYGCNIFAGTPADAAADAGVIEAYLGTGAGNA
jgi:branched-chain amino acid transport system permease protein